MSSILGDGNSRRHSARSLRSYHSLDPFAASVVQSLRKPTTNEIQSIDDVGPPNTGSYASNWRQGYSHMASSTRPSTSQSYYPSHQPYVYIPQQPQIGMVSQQPMIPYPQQPTVLHHVPPVIPPYLPDTPPPHFPPVIPSQAPPVIPSYPLGTSPPLFPPVIPSHILDTPSPPVISNEPTSSYLYSIHGRGRPPYRDRRFRKKRTQPRRPIHTLRPITSGSEPLSDGDSSDSTGSPRYISAPRPHLLPSSSSDKNSISQVIESKPSISSQSNPKNSQNDPASASASEHRLVSPKLSSPVTSSSKIEKLSGTGLIGVGNDQPVTINHPSGFPAHKSDRQESVSTTSSDKYHSEYVFVSRPPTLHSEASHRTNDFKGTHSLRTPSNGSQEIPILVNNDYSPTQKPEEHINSNIHIPWHAPQHTSGNKSSYPSYNDDNHPKPDVGLRSYLITFLTNTLPQQIYLHCFLRLPSLYYSRVTRIFDDADLTMEEIKDMALTTTAEDNKNTYNMLSLGFYHPAENSNLPPAYHKLKANWEHFIDSLMREWKTFNIISALLLSGILTIFQIEGAAADPVTRYLAFWSLISALLSLLYGCLFIIRFSSMRKTYKAAEWALEAQKRQRILWNVWIMLSMPLIWLAWSILTYIMCIVFFMWRVSAASSGETSRLPSPTAELGFRIFICFILGLGVLYGILIIDTLRHYGTKMDLAWAHRVESFIMSPPAIPPDSYPPIQPYPTQGYPQQSYPHGYPYPQTWSSPHVHQAPTSPSSSYEDTMHMTRTFAAPPITTHPLRQYRTSWSSLGSSRSRSKRSRSRSQGRRHTRRELSPVPRSLSRLSSQSRTQSRSPTITSPRDIPLEHSDNVHVHWKSLHSAEGPSEAITEPGVQVSDSPGGLNQSDIAVTGINQQSDSRQALLPISPLPDQDPSDNTAGIKSHNLSTDNILNELGLKNLPSFPPREDTPDSEHLSYCDDGKESLRDAMTRTNLEDGIGVVGNDNLTSCDGLNKDLDTLREAVLPPENSDGILSSTSLQLPD